MPEAPKLPVGFRAVAPIDLEANLGPMWLAEYRGKQVALKLDVPVYLNPRAQPEIRGEWDRLARLRAPGLVGFVDGGFEPRIWIASELVPDARSLEADLEAGGAPVLVRTLEIVTQAAAALTALHEAGMHHGTLEAHDLLLQETPAGPPQVKVNNTWIRVVLHRPPEERRNVMDGGPPPRTLAYLSSEVAAGHMPGPPSDVYSLGAIAYEALAGRPVFVRDQMMAMLMAHMMDAPDPLPANVPQTLADLVMRMLAKKPADRPTMAEVGKGLLGV